VHDSSHKAELYKYLWMLMAADNTGVFQELLQKFLKTWEQTEPRFMKYFRDHYVNRVG